MTVLKASFVVLAAALAGAPAFACSEGTAEFRWQGGEARFAIEIADDEGERARGLMFRETMASGAGMLFIYEEPQQVAFWMKNTIIPLDMIFIGADGRVNGVHSMAVPGDLTAIPGPPETLMVLEVNGGLAGRLGLDVGAELRHPRLEQSTALWPCG